MNQQAQFALKRLNADLSELQKQPIGNVSALPLEDNFFEWHCNIRMPEGTKWAGAVFHIALFFPQDYPAKSPSAEFLPSFKFTGGATKQGKKGTQVCLSIFSDFGTYHPEWKDEKGTGWSPSYTTQTVLLNLVSFIMETSSGSGYYSYGSSSMEENVKLASGFTCKDCGHSHAKPYPPISSEESKPQKAELHESLTCYVTKSNVGNADKSEVFGFGIAKGGNQYNPSLTSPCEYMTLSGFKSLQATKRVESVMREELHYFLPLFINGQHGANIKKEFEAACAEITGKKFEPSLILNVLPKLLNSTVVTFMNGTTHTSERALHGYFAFHRLFLWTVQEYPTLLKEINDTITNFIKTPSFRMKKSTPNVGEWLALLLVSDITWKEASTAYLEENFERNVMWYLKENGSLLQTQSADINKTRLKETFRLTQVSRDLLAFQVLFLDVARPKELTLKEITSRYDNNYGVPTLEMETAMKDAVKKIKGIKDYKDWFTVIKVEYPGDDKLVAWLCKSVDSAQTKDGYTMTNKGGGGGGRGGRGGGRGGKGRY